MGSNNNHNNAEEYINKLYDHTQDKQKQLLTDAYTGHTEALDTQKQNVQQQTDEYLQRTDVEAICSRIASGVKPRRRMAHRVGMRGSSQPVTKPPSTSARR